MDLGSHRGPTRWLSPFHCVLLLLLFNVLDGLLGDAGVWATTTTIVATPENEAALLEAVELYRQARRATHLQNPDQAVELYQKSIEAYPQLASAYNNLAMLLFEISNDRDRALEVLEVGARVAAETNDTQNYAAIHSNIGFLQRHGREEDIGACLQAIAHYDRAIAAEPTSVSALYNKGSALMGMNKRDAAEEIYRLVFALEPLHEGAHLDMGTLCFLRGDIEQAVHHEDTVIQNSKSSQLVMSALNNKGQYLKESGQLLDALNVHEQSLELAPDNAIALSNVVTARRTLCTWNDLEELHDRLVQRQEIDVEAGMRTLSLFPYDSTLLELPDTFRKKLAYVQSKRFEQLQTLDLPAILREDITLQHQRTKPLKIGYLSYDFRDHVMAQLTLGLIELHDAHAVMTFCYSYGINDGSELRKQVESECDVFREIWGVSDLEAAQQIGLDQVDILVDLMAHTKGARLGITALRPSRIIVNYLGYPGTMGSTFTDFAMVDRMVVPPEVAAATMTEQIVYLPHSYQANLYKQTTASCSGSVDMESCVKSNRSVHNLPNGAIVFCNFNTINKMEPASFATWMTILRRVPSSVLWLLEPPKTHGDIVRETMYIEAQSHGVHPSRIIFAEQVDRQEHLSRLTLADIFLDSFIYNAHSTASDALWANLPIVTFWGNTFPSRVAAALISNAMEHSEIVVHSLKDYEDVAVTLADSNHVRRGIRKDLAANGLGSPLFDSDRIANNVETAYQAIEDVMSYVDPDRAVKFQLIINPEASTELHLAENTNLRLHFAVEKALLLHQSGHFQDSIHVYQRVLRVNPHHIDAMHLLGVVYLQQGNTNEAIKILADVVHDAPHVSLYHQNLGAAYLTAGANGSAAQEIMKALELDSFNVRAFNSLVQLYINQKDFEQLNHLYETLAAPLLRNMDADPPGFDRERAFLQYGYALEQIGRSEEAIDLLQTALERYPSFFRIGYNLAAMLIMKKQYHRGDTIQLAAATNESRHNFQLQGVHFRKRARPKDKIVVAIYCYEYGNSWWSPWGPSSLEKGIGGSEEAVIHLARELWQLGYWVEVYGELPEHDITHSSLQNQQDQVLWYPHTSYDIDDGRVDVFIAWRYHTSLALGINARSRYLWMHDLSGEDLAQSSFMAEFVSGIFCVSEFQAAQMPPILRSKVIVTSNALDPAYFVDGPNLPLHFVYGSAPNRGLMTLLTVWPRIREALPNATLTIYYGFTRGFESWAKIYLPSYPEFKRKLEHMMRTYPGIDYVGLVNHSTLAEGYTHAGFYLYPTTFSETSCISLMKAMAYGAIPITSRFPWSALSETCAGYDVGPRAIQGSNPGEDPEWLELWINSIVEAVRNADQMTSLRQEMKQFARQKYQWRNVAEQWSREFASHKG